LQEKNNAWFRQFDSERSVFVMNSAEGLLLLNEVLGKNLFFDRYDLLFLSTLFIYMRLESSTKSMVVNS
jgi:hypothetical protein